MKNKTVEKLKDFMKSLSHEELEDLGVCTYDDGSELDDYAHYLVENCVSHSDKTAWDYVDKVFKEIDYDPYDFITEYGYELYWKPRYAERFTNFQVKWQVVRSDCAGINVERVWFDLDGDLQYFVDDYKYNDDWTTICADATGGLDDINFTKVFNTKEEAWDYINEHKGEEPWDNDDDDGYNPYTDYDDDPHIQALHNHWLNNAK